MFKAKTFKKTKALKTGYPKSSPMPEGGERVKTWLFNYLEYAVSLVPWIVIARSISL
jgi:hypothetical protein